MASRKLVDFVMRHDGVLGTGEIMRTMRRRLAPVDDADRELVDRCWKVRHRRALTDDEERQLYAALRRAWLESKKEGVMNELSIEGRRFVGHFIAAYGELSVAAKARAVYLTVRSVAHGTSLALVPWPSDARARKKSALIAALLNGTGLSMAELKTYFHPAHGGSKRLSDEDKVAGEAAWDSAMRAFAAIARVGGRQ